jgi:hypothetical protein
MYLATLSAEQIHACTVDVTRLPDLIHFIPVEARFFISSVNGKRNEDMMGLTLPNQSPNNKFVNI